MSTAIPNCLSNPNHSQQFWTTQPANSLQLARPWEPNLFPDGSLPLPIPWPNRQTAQPCSSLVPLISNNSPSLKLKTSLLKTAQARNLKPQMNLCRISPKSHLWASPVSCPVCHQTLPFCHNCSSPALGCAGAGVCVLGREELAIRGSTHHPSFHSLICSIVLSAVPQHLPWACGGHLRTKKGHDCPQGAWPCRVAHRQTRDILRKATKSLELRRTLLPGQKA